jgi:hypothetical protein
MIKIQVQLTAHHSGIFPNSKCLPPGGNLLVWSSHISAIHEQTPENCKYKTMLTNITHIKKHIFLLHPSPIPRVPTGSVPSSKAAMA